MARPEGLIAGHKIFPWLKSFSWFPLEGDMWICDDWTQPERTVCDLVKTLNHLDLHWQDKSDMIQRSRVTTLKVVGRSK